MESQLWVHTFSSDNLTATKQLQEKITLGGTKIQSKARVVSKVHKKVHKCLSG